MSRLHFDKGETTSDNSRSFLPYLHQLAGEPMLVQRLSTRIQRGIFTRSQTSTHFVPHSPMNRTQRSSVRGLTSGAPPDAVVLPVDNDSAPSQPIPEPDPCLILLDDEYPSLSRSVSSQNLGEGSSKGTNGHGARKRGRPKGKGKEREKETEAPVILVKEEPVTTQIPEPPPAYAPVSCLLSCVLP